MKTRIISAVVGIIIFILAIALSFKSTVVLGVALAILNAIGIYEMLYNTKLVSLKPLVFVASAFGASVLLILGFATRLGSIIFCLPLYLAYFFVIAVASILLHKQLNSTALFTLIAAPLILSVAFGCLYLLFVDSRGMKGFQFFFIFLFAWGADTGAYFTGTFLGKHKLAPEISPKKTVEGSVGGIITAVLLSCVCGLIYKYCFDVDVSFLRLCIYAAVFSVFGMIGDLFTSFIKRDCGIKDYGNIMPGHGGVLDRFDSVLFIAPFYFLATQISIF